MRLRSPALVAGCIALLLALPVALANYRSDSLSAAQGSAAIHAVLRDPGVRHVLAGTGWNRVSASKLDSTSDRVSFYAGARLVADVAWSGAQGVIQTSDYAHRRVPSGNWLAFQPLMLLGLAVVFVLMCGVVPVRRIRNLDVLMSLSLLAPVLLIQQRYRSASVLAALPGLCYLLGRCSWVGLRGGGGAPSTPLLNWCTRRADPRQRVSALRLLLAALILIFVMVGVGSPAPADVIYGVMEGATKMLHGVLPYGHLPGDIVHGDTYPPLSYVLYMPVALFAPVNSAWDSVDGALAFGVAAAGAAALLLGFAVRRPGARHTAVGFEETGLRAAIAWLSFPSLLVTVSTGTTDVMLALLLLIALLLWRRPAAGGLSLALAGWFKLVPFALLPMWLASHRGRARIRGALAFGAFSALVLGLVVALGGAGAVGTMVHAVSFQFSRGSPQTIWSALGIDTLRPVGQALTVALIAAFTAQLARSEAGASTRQLAAIAAATMIALQLVGNNWAFTYVVWCAPLLSLSLLVAEASRAVQPKTVLVHPYLDALNFGAQTVD